MSVQTSAASASTVFGPLYRGVGNVYVKAVRVYWQLGGLFTQGSINPGNGAAPNTLASVAQLRRTQLTPAVLAGRSDSGQLLREDGLDNCMIDPIPRPRKPRHHSKRPTL